jgi:hypothetical protein
MMKSEKLSETHLAQSLGFSAPSRSMRITRTFWTTAMIIALLSGSLQPLRGASRFPLAAAAAVTGRAPLARASMSTLPATMRAVLAQNESCVVAEVRRIWVRYRDGLRFVQKWGMWHRISPRSPQRKLCARLAAEMRTPPASGVYI